MGWALKERYRKIKLCFLEASSPPPQLQLVHFFFLFNQELVEVSGLSNDHICYGSDLPDFLTL